MKHKLFYLLSVVFTLPLWLSCSYEPKTLPYPRPNIYSSRTAIELSIADSLGNDLLQGIPLSPEEVKDTSLSAKALLYTDYIPFSPELGFPIREQLDFPDNQRRKRVSFEFTDSTAFKKSDLAPFHRTYRLGLRIPSLFLDKDYHFIDLTCVYDKQTVTLLSATFEGKELAVRSDSLISKERSFVRGCGLVHLVYTPKGK